MHTKLGDFIRAHRERVTPGAVGLPGGGRAARRACAAKNWRSCAMSARPGSRGWSRVEKCRHRVSCWRAWPRCCSEPVIDSLIADLAQGSAEFHALWTLQDVVGRDGGLRRFQHPRLGALHFTQVTLHLAQRHDLKLVMLLP